MTLHIDPNQLPPIVLNDGLMTKLACIVYYLQQVRAGRRESNVRGMNSILDDAELNDWIDQMNRRNMIGTRL
jgi:hypothetical protein